MESNNFYDDRKFCTDCNEYVPYLASIERSYCVQCGAEVRLFSTEDWERFQNGLGNRPLAGRKTKTQGRSGAIIDAKAAEAEETTQSTEFEQPDDQRESA
jgi:hypothetical protein